MSGNNSFIVGQYYPAESIGHRLDPRAKILIAAALMILSILTTAVQYYLVIIAGILILLVVSNISPIVLLRNFKPFLILVLVTALYHLIFSARDSMAVFEFRGIRLTEGGVYLAVSFSLRVLVFIGIAFFISLTTLPSDIAETLVVWMKPLKKLKVPVDDIGLIIFIAIRFIPVLADEFDTVKKAQIIRGVDFSGKLTKRVRNYIYLFIPVFQSALRRADDLAVAIESRGYISGVPRTSYRYFELHPADWFFIFLSVLYIAGAYLYFG